jgi:hypothetical protein
MWFAARATESSFIAWLLGPDGEQEYRDASAEHQFAIGETNNGNREMRFTSGTSMSPDTKRNSALPSVAFTG